MTQLLKLFQNVLTASFHGSIVILAVLLLRLVLKKTPKKFVCLLWLLAGLRLLMPFEIQSTTSLQPEFAPVMQQQFVSTPNPTPAPTSAPDSIVDAPSERPASPVLATPTPVEAPESPAPTAEVKSTFPTGMMVLSWMWLIVVLCFIGYSIYSYLHLRFQVRCAVKIPGGWECDTIDTAFILGFLRPQIYIPMGMPSSVRQYILAHERTHLEKGDHWFKMIGFLALSLHWFNPLVWVAYTLLCKDIEMACDERVVQFMDLSERKAYSAALLRCSANRMHFSACPVAFGEVSVKARIKSVLNYKKPSFWISLAGVLAIFFVAVCLLTSPVDKSPKEDASPVVSVSTVDELLAALAPNTTIELQSGTYDLTTASTYGQDTASAYYTWVSVYDGYRLELHGLEGLTLRGSGSSVTELVTRPRYADVLLLKSCTGITLEGFTAGHTDGTGECSGGVIALESCSDISLDDLGLYGCGVVGLNAYDSTNITLTGSDIYDCSSDAVTLTSCQNVSLSGCNVYRIGSNNLGGGNAFATIDTSQNVSISNCKFSDSTLFFFLTQVSSDVTLRDNLFTGNRAKEAAFNHEGLTLTCIDNVFQDNTIRAAYTSYGMSPVDENGDPVTIPTSDSDDATGETLRDRLEIHVSTVDEFLAAIGSHREIILDAPLYDLSTATGYGTVSGENYLWQDIFDGPGLIIRNVSNMTIRSGDGDVTGHTISATPRYADVLTFSSCDHITLSGFTAGHTKEPGSCAGGVLEFQDCSNMTVDNCGLFGCGILGVYAEFSQDLTVSNCDIYECSEGGIKMYDCDRILLENNTYRDLGGEATRFTDCTAITAHGDAIDDATTAVDPAPAYAATAAAAPSETSDLYDQLELAAEDFFNAYIGASDSDLRSRLASTFSGTPTRHPKAGLDSTVRLATIGIPSGYSFDLANNGFCTATLCMRSTPTSDVEYLTLVLVPEDGWKVQDYYPDTAPDILETSWFTDCCNFLFPLTTENYTGKLLYISDPSKVFLGISTQDGFSADIPGKRLDEILDAYPGTIAAVNAGAFFDDGTASTAVGSQPLGLTISQGEVADSSYQQLHPNLQGFVGFDTSNKLVVRTHALTQEEADTLHIRDGCAIGPALIIDGQDNQAVLETNSGISARTAIGQLSNGAVIFVCINGRAFDSIGASYADMIHIMRSFGAVNACLLQGGSATGMMCSLRGGERQLVTDLQPNQSQPRRLPTYWMVKK